MVRNVVSPDDVASASLLPSPTTPPRLQYHFLATRTDFYSSDSRLFCRLFHQFRPEMLQLHVKILWRHLAIRRIFQDISGAKGVYRSLQVSENWTENKKRWKKIRKHLRKTEILERKNGFLLVSDESFWMICLWWNRKISQCFFETIFFTVSFTFLVIRVYPVSSIVLEKSLPFYTCRDPQARGADVPYSYCEESANCVTMIEELKIGAFYG